MMPIWAQVYYELVFGETCPPEAQELIVANADDVLRALKATGLRHMDRRDRLTRYLQDRIEAGTCPVVLPEPFTGQETAWYLQGAFFNTAVVQMSEAMAHVLLALAQHPPVQHRLAAALTEPAEQADEALDRVINEALRVYPLFGVAHRITSAPIRTAGVDLPAGSVLLFNYPAFHRTGAASDGRFDPDRWLTLKPPQAHHIPFGVTENRACPARGMAPVMMRAVLREVLLRYDLTSSVSHTRSLASRGPCYLTPVGADGPGRRQLQVMRLADRWADVGRSLRQLVLGTAMVIDARRQRLCTTYFEEVLQ
jgi:hypothetical protein